MPIWSTLSSLTDGADIKTGDTTLIYSDFG